MTRAGDLSEAHQARRAELLRKHSYQIPAWVVWTGSFGSGSAGEIPAPPRDVFSEWVAWRLKTHARSKALERGRS